MDQGDNDELSRLMRLLDLVVKEAGLTYMQLEERLGWSSGSLSRLLSGGRELKLRQLLDILRVVGMRPSRFFVISEEQGAIERTLSLRAIILNSIVDERKIPHVETALSDD
ncbi:MAG TPA: helix-turn-helix domain-containing protein, partial [Thermoanaerobaculia bacterium]|nr:helix-turn-helix domain-containing protein [Thermoanaerobaculia bacterium]